MQTNPQISFMNGFQRQRHLQPAVMPTLDNLNFPVSTSFVQPSKLTQSFEVTGNETKDSIYHKDDYKLDTSAQTPTSPDRIDSQSHSPNGNSNMPTNSTALSPLIFPPNTEPISDSLVPSEDFADPYNCHPSLRLTPQSLYDDMLNEMKRRELKENYNYDPAGRSNFIDSLVTPAEANRSCIIPGSVSQEGVFESSTSRETEVYLSEYLNQSSNGTATEGEIQACTDQLPDENVINDDKLWQDCNINISNQFDTGTMRIPARNSPVGLGLDMETQEQHYAVDQHKEGNQVLQEEADTKNNIEEYDSDESNPEEDDYIPEEATGTAFQSGYDAHNVRSSPPRHSSMFPNVSPIKQVPLFMQTSPGLRSCSLLPTIGMDGSEIVTSESLKNSGLHSDFSYKTVAKNLMSRSCPNRAMNPMFHPYIYLRPHMTSRGPAKENLSQLQRLMSSYDVPKTSHRSVAKMPLSRMYAIMGFPHDHVRAKWREEKIMEAVREEGFALGSQTWIRDTTEPTRQRIIAAVSEKLSDFGYSPEVLEIVIRRGSYARMQSRLRQQRRLNRNHKIV